MVKRGYHHGNLSQALVDATLALIETKGPTGFTLSETAKQAGVTPAAVYRHYRGRDDLIAEAARQGYEIFGRMIEEAYRGDHRSALSAFEATGRAYLAFAMRYPGHYVAMFESGIGVMDRPGLRTASRRATDILEQAAGDLARHIPAERRPPAWMFASHIWAMCHGVVELFARNSPGTTVVAPPEDLLESGIGIYLRGLGLIPPDA